MLKKIIVISILLVAGCSSSTDSSEAGPLIISCPEDARVCEDGTIVTRQGTECTFAACPEDLVNETN